MFHYRFDNPPKYSLLRNAITNRGLNTKKAEIVEILCYCLMPNHFHMLVKQLGDSGITKFMSRIQNSYTRFFNTKYDRIGPLFQGPFKAVLIETDEQLTHVSRYIHLNPFVANLVKTPEKYDWSSYKSFLVPGASNLEISKDEILGFFKSKSEYHNFVMDHADYARSLEAVKHKIIDF